MVYPLEVDHPDVENEMTLLRDAFDHEGFSSVVSRFPSKFIFWVGKHDRSTQFYVDFHVESEEFTVRDPEGLPLSMKFDSLAEAVSHGCELFSIFPSWEMEKFPMLWEHLMEE